MKQIPQTMKTAKDERMDDISIPIEEIPHDFDGLTIDELALRVSFTDLDYPPLAEQTFEVIGLKCKMFKMDREPTFVEDANGNKLPGGQYPNGRIDWNEVLKVRAAYEAKIRYIKAEAIFRERFNRK